jgi:hypothetical protein
LRAPEAWKSVEACKAVECGSLLIECGALLWRASWGAGVTLFFEEDAAEAVWAWRCGRAAPAGAVDPLVAAVAKRYAPPTKGAAIDWFWTRSIARASAPAEFSEGTGARDSRCAAGDDSCTRSACASCTSHGTLSSIATPRLCHAMRRRFSAAVSATATRHVLGRRSTSPEYRCTTGPTCGGARCVALPACRFR